ncbi:hypothetical protein ABFS82_12G036500 [Erythranthe guttata]
MDHQNDAVSTTNSCSKKPYDKSGSFVDNLKNRFDGFVNTPMKDHKDCFKLSWHRMIDRFSTKTTSANEEVQTPVTVTDLQPASRN